MKETIVIGGGAIAHLNHQAAEATPYVRARRLVPERHLPLVDQRSSLVTVAELA